MTNDDGRQPPDFVRSAMLGFVGGLRSMMPLALLASHLQQPRRSSAPATRGWALDWLAGAWAARLLGVAALGEVVADKLPMVPARIEPLPLAGRVVLAGTASALASQADGEPVDTAALIGALGAIAGSLAGYSLRTWLSRRLPVPSLSVALAEDILAFSLGRWAIEREQR